MPPPAPRNARRIALTAVAVAFLAGTVAILVAGASLAHFGTLIFGCTALGTILVSVLDRHRGPQAAKR